jgi:NAD(P)-dependent dehydrogenase (short-subunit alcohol dehydrogenase family)
VVTGAAQGIGKAYAEALADDGMSVVVADLNAAGAEETAKSIADRGGQTLAIQVDVSDRASTLALAAAAKEQFGAVHVLVNNAAIYHSMKLDPQMTVDIDYWRKIFSVNLDGALLCTQAIAPLMIEAGWGRVVNQSSAGAYFGNGGAYSCAKLALVGLTQGFARELGAHGITVNAIAPGPTDTEATRVTLPSVATEGLVARQSIKRMGQPADMVHALRYLVSEDAGWITSQVLLVDGGFITRV